MSNTEETINQPDPEIHVSKVTLKIPPFWRKNVRVWLRQVEAQFITTGIKHEQTKYYHVLGNLDSDVAELISDFLEKPLSQTPYQDLCNRLISEFEESESRKFTKLVDELELGSKKPSQFLKEMRSLAGPHVQDDFLKTIFLKRLPLQISSILASSSDSLDKLAVMADKIIEYSPIHSQQIHSMEGHPSTSAQPDRLSRLETQISELANQISSLRSRSRSNSHSRQTRKHDTAPQSEICWYHKNFGKHAKKCLLPCNYRSSQSGNSEN
jgi:hypothetical protein